MLSSAAQRLIRLYGLRPGSKAVVATTNDGGYQVALDLIGAEVEVAAVVVSRPGAPGHTEAARDLEEAGVPILTSCVVAKAVGKTRLREVLVQSEEAGESDGSTRKILCDLLCMSGEIQQADGLLYQAGAKRDHDRDPGDPACWVLPPRSSRGRRRDRIAEPYDPAHAGAVGWPGGRATSWRRVSGAAGRHRQRPGS